jgi:hypothetical protein
LNPDDWVVVSEQSDIKSGVDGMLPSISACNPVFVPSYRSLSPPCTHTMLSFLILAPRLYLPLDVETDTGILDRIGLFVTGEECEMDARGRKGVVEGESVSDFTSE